MKKIISISTKNNFIKVFTEELLYKESRKDYSDTCVVFPGKRPFLYLRKYLADKTRSTFYPPKILTINEFINYITEKQYPDLNIINEIDGVWELYHIILNNGLLDNMPDLMNNRYNNFLDFYPWTKKTYNFINQTDIEDIDDKILKNIRDNAEIGYDIPEQINALFINIVKIRSLFHRWLEKNHHFTRGYSYLKAKEIIEKIDLKEFNKIYFAGLFALTGTEKKIIKKLMQDDKACLVWHGHPDDWRILKSLQDYFKEEIEFIREKRSQKEEGTKECMNHFNNYKNLKIYSAFDSHSEAQQVYNILKKEEQIKDTVIVAPKNDTLFPLLSFAVDRLIFEKKIDKFNISLDYPVSKTSLFSLIKNMIDCQLLIRKKDDTILYYIESYINFLNTPFIKNITINKIPVREILRTLDNHFIDDKSNLYNKIFISLEELEASLDKSFQKVIKEIHRIFFENLESSISLKDMCTSMETALDFILEKSDIRSYILSGEIFNLLFENLLTTKENKFACEKFSKEEDRIKLWEFFLKLIENTSITFDTVPLQDLEIIGMLETRTLNFKNVLILDVQEGIIPVKKKIDPLIPESILKGMGMPPPEFQEEIYEYYFYRLIENAEKVHLLYLETPEMDRSRYIEHLIWEEEKAKKQLNTKKIDRIKFKINLMLDTGENHIEKNKKIMGKIESMEYSPSAIDNYMLCQIKFYYNNILNLTIPQTISTDIDAMDRGKIIHDILKDLFDKFKGQKLGEEKFSEVKEELNCVFEKNFQNRVLTGEFYLFKKMAFKKLNQFLEQYIKRARNEFKIIETEKSLSSTYKFDNNTIDIKGRIDRVDINYYDNYWEYMIIDYKTGNSSRKFQYKEELIEEKNIEKIQEHIKSFQLPIYIYIYMKNHKNIKLDQINAKLIYLGDLEDDILLAAKENLKKEKIYGYYDALLGTVLCDLFNKDRPFIRYKDVKCEYCEFNNLCKFR